MAVKPWVGDGAWFLSAAHPIGDSSANVADLRYMPDDISADAITEFSTDNLLVKATERFAYWGVSRKGATAFYGSLMRSNNA